MQEAIASPNRLVAVKPSISVIIPVRNGARTLPRVLRTLAQTNPRPFEIIVVDDGSTDDSAALVEAMGCRLIRLTENAGAAAAKNRGAAEARGEILFFTDSDILIPPDLFARLSLALDRNGSSGIVGLLDPQIPARNFASQYKNLWMYYTYAQLASSPRVGLFYTSAAAIRRDLFHQLGGFDENYRDASVTEDNEFGQRVWAAGYTLTVAPNLTVTHLKEYGLGELWRTDFVRARALTLMRLRKWGQPFFTSVPIYFQVGVPVLYLTLGAFLFFLLTRNSLALLFAFGGLGIFYALNAPLVAFLARGRGTTFVLQSLLFVPLDACVVGLGMLAAMIDFARGQKY